MNTTNITQNIRNIVTMGILLAISGYAMADGLDNGKEAITNFSTWLYSAIGAGSAGYLGWEGIKLYGNKIQWQDFGIAAVKVFGVGGTGALATWAFSAATKA